MKTIFYKNILEYLDSKQSPDDIHYKYRKHKERIRLQLEAQAAGEYLYDKAAATLSKEIQKVLNYQ